MTILVTGAQGFVGSHLINLLNKKNFKLYALSRYRLKREPIKGKKLKWIHADLNNPKSVDRCIQTVKPDLIFHLAAQASVAESWEKPSKTFKSNVLGTLYLLESLFKQRKKSRIIAVESGEVYGRGKNFTEKSPLNPENPYAASKASVDFALKSFSDHPKVQIIRVRPFNHIGPGQSPRFAVGNFSYQIAAIEKGILPAEIHVGNLNPKRDFTDVRDVVRAYWLLATKGKPGTAYNICSGRQVAIKTILNKLLSLSKNEIKINVDPKLVRKKEILLISASSHKLKKETNWKAKIPLDQSLEDSLNFYRKKLNKK